MESRIIREQAAIAAHPELRLLALLRDSGGWRFTHYDTDVGETDLTIGIRTWPDGTAEALGIRSSTEAQAVRTNPYGELVWKREGDLVTVLTGLLELPPPDHPRAPRLIIPGSPPPLRNLSA